MPTLIETLEIYRVPFRRHGEHHHSGVGWLSVDCPKCSLGSGRFRLGFEISTGRSNCWMCGATDGVASLSKICHGLSLRDAAAVLLGQAGVVRHPRNAHAGTLVLPHASELLEPHRQYLINRGFNPDEVIRLWGVKGIGLHVRLGWRILIPISDRIGRVVSWTTRSIGSNLRRYISASENEETVPHKTLLYGAHLARHVVIVVEGPIDVWAIGPGAVATFGVAFSQPQVAEMCTYPVRVVCFDSESDAQRRAESLCNHLSAFPGRTENVILQTGKDPAQADRVEILELREQFLN